MTIREATTNDLDALTKMYGETLDYHHKLDNSYYKQVSEETKEEFRKVTAKQMDEKSLIVFIAEENNSPIGFITFSIQKEGYFDTKVAHFVEVDEVYVREAVRGRGIGKALLEEAQKYAKMHKIKYVVLHCSTQNPKSLAFYKHLGYEDKQRILIKNV